MRISRFEITLYNNHPKLVWNWTGIEYINISYWNIRSIVRRLELKWTRNPVHLFTSCESLSEINDYILVIDNIVTIFYNVLLLITTFSKSTESPCVKMVKLHFTCLHFPNTASPKWLALNILVITPFTCFLVVQIKIYLLSWFIYLYDLFKSFCSLILIIIAEYLVYALLMNFAFCFQVRVLETWQPFFSVVSVYHLWQSLIRRSSDVWGCILIHPWAYSRSYCLYDVGYSGQNANSR